MIDKDLLDILACPESHQALSELSSEALAVLNARVAQGECKNVGESAVEGPLEGGLLREDRAIVYPIRDGIPVLLVEEGIPVADFGLRG